MDIRKIRVKVKPAIVLQKPKTYGIKFYGSAVTGTRTGDAVGLTARVGSDDGVAVINDFDDEPIWGQIHQVEETAYSSSLLTSKIKNADGSVVKNTFVAMPNFWWRVTAGTDDGGNFVHIQVSTFKQEGFSPAFKNLDGKFPSWKLSAAYWITSLPNSTLMGCCKGQIPSANGLPWSRSMSYIYDKALNAFEYEYNESTDLYEDMAVQLKGGESYDCFCARAILMVVEFGTRNLQSILPGNCSQGWADMSGQSSHSHGSTASNEFACPTSWTAAVNAYVGGPVSIWANGVWNTKTITAVARDTDVNGTCSGYTKITFSGAALVVNSLVAGNWGQPVGQTSSIVSSSGVLTKTTDGVDLTGGVYHSFKWRGFEDPYGEFWNILYGIAIKKTWKNGAAYNSLVYLGSSGTASSPSTFADTDVSTIATGSSEGWTTQMTFADAPTGKIFIPALIGGSDNTYYSDYTWMNWNADSSVADNYNEVLVGGTCNNGSQDGPFCVNLNSGFGVTNLTCASRPSVML